MLVPQGYVSSLSSPHITEKDGSGSVDCVDEVKVSQSPLWLFTGTLLQINTKSLNKV